MTTLFYVTDILLVILLTAVTVKFIRLGNGLEDGPFQVRRKLFICFYILLIVNVLLSATIVYPQGVEVYSSLPVCTLYFVFSVFMMMATAHFGKDYYRNVFIWLLIIQYGFMFLVLSLLCRILGLYEPIFSLEGLFDADNHFIVYGRIYFLTIMLAVCLLMLAVLVESFVSNLRHRKFEPSEYKSRPGNDAETINILLYVVVFSASLTTYFYTYILPHIICNVLLGAMVLRSNYTYGRYLKAMRDEVGNRAVYREISEKINQLLEQENDNPIYKSNTNIDEIADAINVGRDDMSSYIYRELGTSFASWVCEKKLLRCADQIANTSRKISEIAINTGYMDLPAMSKAFKKRFGVTPSEYRKSNMS